MWTHAYGACKLLVYILCLKLLNLVMKLAKGFYANFLAHYFLIVV